MNSAERRVIRRRSTFGRAYPFGIRRPRGVARRTRTCKRGYGLESGQLTVGGWSEKLAARCAAAARRPQYARAALRRPNHVIDARRAHATGKESPLSSPRSPTRPASPGVFAGHYDDIYAMAAGGWRVGDAQTPVTWLASTAASRRATDAAVRRCRSAVSTMTCASDWRRRCRATEARVNLVDAWCQMAGPRPASAITSRPDRRAVSGAVARTV